MELDASSYMYDIQNRKQQLLFISYCYRDIRLQTLKKGGCKVKSKNKQQTTHLVLFDLVFIT